MGEGAPKRGALSVRRGANMQRYATDWGNEKADELAKIGTTSTRLVKGYIPQSHIKALINQKVNLLDQTEWTRNEHCHTNTILGNKRIIKTKSLSTTEYIIELPSNFAVGVRFIVICFARFW